MAYSYVNYVGDGSTAIFSLTFPYLDQADVAVTVDGEAVTFTWSDADTVELDAAPALDAVVQIRRTTDPETARVDFENGVTLTAELLDQAFLQHLYLSQESLDAYTDALKDNGSGYFDAESKRITNMATPLNAADAATKAYVDAYTVGGNVADAQAAAADAEVSATEAAASAALAATYGAGAVLRVGDTMTGALEMSGAAINEARAGAVASATSIDLRTIGGNYVHVTGTTTIDTIQLNDGDRRLITFDGSLTLTNGAGLVLPTGANITTAAGDHALFVGDSGSVTRCIGFFRASGAALAEVGFSGLVAEATDTQVFTADGTWNRPATGQLVCVLCVGGGGGGGMNSSSTSSAYGGGGGDAVVGTFVRADFGSTVAVTVGAGGAGKTTSSGTGAPGEESSFGTYLTAQGGSGGRITSTSTAAGLGSSAYHPPGFTLNSTTKFVPMLGGFSPVGIDQYDTAGGATKGTSGGAASASSSSTIYCTGGSSSAYNTGSGSNGTGYGAGGGGGYSAGGNGTDGLVAVLTF